MEQIISFFESLEDSIFSQQKIYDQKLSSRKMLVQNLIKKRKTSIINEMKAIKNDDKVIKCQTTS